MTANHEMTTTTEEAERHARLLGIFPAPAAALRSLAAERDDLAKRLKDAERERNHQHGRANRNAAQYAAEQAKREQLQAENARMREVLEKLARLGAEPYYGNSDGNMIARAALGEKE